MRPLLVQVGLALLLVLASGSLRPCPGQFADLEARIAEARRDGRFVEVLRLAGRGIEDGAIGGRRALLHYERGNALHRLGRDAEALLEYRRALLRSPGDPRLLGNSRLVEERLGLAAGTWGEPEGLAARIDPRWPLAALAVLQGLALLVLVSRRGTRGQRLLAAVLLLASLPCTWSLGRPFLVSPTVEAVVLAPEVALRREPHVALPATARIPAGERLEVLETSDRWMRVSHGRGSGWVEFGGVGIVD